MLEAQGVQEVDPEEAPLEAYFPAAHCWQPAVDAEVPEIMKVQLAGDTTSGEGPAPVVKVKVVLLGTVATVVPAVLRQLPTTLAPTTMPVVDETVTVMVFDAVKVVPVTVTEAIEAEPAAHAVHVMAPPVEAPVLVPAGQAVQIPALVPLAEYVLAPQDWHDCPR